MLPSAPTLAAANSAPGVAGHGGPLAFKGWNCVIAARYVGAVAAVPRRALVGVGTVVACYAARRCLVMLFIATLHVLHLRRSGCVALLLLLLLLLPNQLSVVLASA